MYIHGETGTLDRGEKAIELAAQACRNAAKSVV